MEIASLLSLFLPLLTNLLGGAGVIPAALQKLVTATAAAIPALIANLITNKTSPTAEIPVALQAIQTEIAALKASNLLFTLNQANMINTLDQSIQDSIVAYQKSQQVTDPSNMAPLPTDLKPDVHPTASE